MPHTITPPVPLFVGSWLSLEGRKVASSVSLLIRPLEPILAITEELTPGKPWETCQLFDAGH